MALTPRQARFVEEYLIDLNATRAAVRAGYGARTAYTVGPRLTRQAPVAEAIAAGRRERAERAGVSAERVLGEYARMAFSDIRRAVTWRTLAPEADGEGGGRKRGGTGEIQVLDADLVDDDTGLAIAEVSQAAGGALRIKMHDKKGALDSLARHLGLFDGRAPEARAPVDPIDSPEMSAGLSGLTSEQRAALRAAIRAAVAK